jgi:FkbM family methyltransferase
MEFVSYAQNLEDVMLYRALKYVEHGFYIDVGAWHPVMDSVTKAFYDRGWRGINIEPEREYFDLLEQDRPEDVNLNVATGAYQGEMIFYEVAGTGLSTADRASADLAVGAGRSARQITMPCTTLAAVCREREIGAIHFLKIDVEGAERAVLEGCDFGIVRPWIIVVEANEPNSTRDVSEAWEHLIVNHDYDFVYYDGLNRFYLAGEHPELRQSFAAPPNVFDNYVMYLQVRYQEELEEAHQSLEAQALQVSEAHQSLEAQALQVSELHQSLEAQALRVAELEYLRQEQLDEMKKREQERNAACRALEDALAAERVQREILAREIGELRASHSWRYTGPLRFVSRTAGYVVHGAIAWLTFAPSSRPRRMLRAFVVRVGNWAWRHPRYADNLNSSLRRFPALHRRLKSAIRGNISIAKSEFSVPKLDDMPPHVRHIYSILKEKQNITH